LTASLLDQLRILQLDNVCDRQVVPNANKHRQFHYQTVGQLTAEQNEYLNP
jgi:hypothetical protein